VYDPILALTTQNQGEDVNGLRETPTFTGGVESNGEAGGTQYKKRARVIHQGLVEKKMLIAAFSGHSSMKRQAHIGLRGRGDAESWP